MDYAEIIVREASSLPSVNQEEVLNFIAFLKMRQSRTEQILVPQTLGEIEAFFRSFNVDTSKYKFDRKEANAR